MRTPLVQGRISRVHFLSMLKFAFVALVLAGAAGAAPYSAVHFFGDSLSDTGNIFRTTTILHDGTFGLFPIEPASPPYFNGRFSNGPVWTETVAQRLGQPTASQPAGMSLGVLGSNTGPGNNYAIGGARTGMGGALGAFDGLVPTGIQAQTNFYFSRTGNTADPNALYFFLGGGNDLRDATALDDPTARSNAALQAASTLAGSVYRMYASGARNIVMVNAPNIGFVPETIANNRIQQGTEASQVFNFVLDFYRNAFRNLPGLSLTYFDLYGFYNELVVDTLQGGSGYGFNSLTPCINPGPGVPSCNDTMFFDDIHPTARVHSLFGNRLADQLLQAISSSDGSFTSAMAVAETPEPSTVIGGAAGVLLVVIARRRQRRAVSSALLEKDTRRIVVQ